MIRTARFFARFTLALSTATLLVMPSMAATTPGLLGNSNVSATGSYLAGREALRDLHTAAAASYFLDSSSAAWDNPMVVEGTFQALASDGRVEDAATIAQRLIELEPGNAMARMVIGAVALKERRYESVLNQLGNVGQDSFIGITGAILRAWAEVGANDYAGAQQVLNPLADAGLSDFLVFHRALMADVAGQRSEALDWVRQSYEAEPTVARIVEAYVRMLANDSRFDEAQAVLDEYTAAGFDHPLVLQLQDAVSNQQRPGKFAGTAQAGAAEMFHGIGAALVRDGSRDVGMLYLQLGRYLDPASTVIDMAVAEVLDSAGRHEAANEIYRAIPNDSPLKPEAEVQLAENFDALGDREQAISTLRQIASADPDDLDAVSSLGDILRYDEQYDAAAEAYSRAIEIVGGTHPNDWRYFYVRGIAYERDGDWDAAEADFLRALDLNPEQPQVLNYLGYSWIDRGENLERALEMVRNAVSWDPTDGYVVDSLGWAYYKLDRIEEAVQTLERAVQLRPDDPEINDHLGDAYWRAGRKLEARFQWNIASSLDEDGNVTERVAPKLENGLDSATN